MADFGVGDTVRLKAGGPLMVVDTIGARFAGGKTSEALCSWFVTNKGKQERQQDWFELTSLKKDQ
jgi:uncharacterized protein YodC (DUF2158 family)